MADGTCLSKQLVSLETPGYGKLCSLVTTSAGSPDQSDLVDSSTESYFSYMATSSWELAAFEVAVAIAGAEIVLASCSSCR